MKFEFTVPLENCRFRLAAEIYLNCSLCTDYVYICLPNPLEGEYMVAFASLKWRIHPFPFICFYFLLFYIYFCTKKPTNDDLWNFEQSANFNENASNCKKFCEHKQASTGLNFASKLSKGHILRALENFKGPFDTPSIYKLYKITFCQLKVFGQLYEKISRGSCMYLHKTCGLTELFATSKAYTRREVLVYTVFWQYIWLLLKK